LFFFALPLPSLEASFPLTKSSLRPLPSLIYPLTSRLPDALRDHCSCFYFSTSGITEPFRCLQERLLAKRTNPKLPPTPLQDLTFPLSFSLVLTPLNLVPFGCFFHIVIRCGWPTAVTRPLSPLPVVSGHPPLSQKALASDPPFF